VWGCADYRPGRYEKLEKLYKERFPNENFVSSIEMAERERDREREKGSPGGVAWLPDACLPAPDPCNCIDNPAPAC
jgi:hypothetical protein